jgi:hypothetical protein
MKYLILFLIVIPLSCSRELVYEEVLKDIMSEVPEDLVELKAQMDALNNSSSFNGTTSPKIEILWNSVSKRQGNIYCDFLVNGKYLAMAGDNKVGRSYFYADKEKNPKFKGYIFVVPKDVSSMDMRKFNIKDLKKNKFTGTIFYFDVDFNQKLMVTLQSGKTFKRYPKSSRNLFRKTSTVKGGSRDNECNFSCEYIRIREYDISSYHTSGHGPNGEETVEEWLRRLASGLFAETGSYGNGGSSEWEPDPLDPDCQGADCCRIDPWLTGCTIDCVDNPNHPDCNVDDGEDDIDWDDPWWIGWDLPKEDCVWGMDRASECKDSGLSPLNLSWSAEICVSGCKPEPASCASAYVLWKALIPAAAGQIVTKEGSATIVSVSLAQSAGRGDNSGGIFAVNVRSDGHVLVTVKGGIGPLGVDVSTTFPFGGVYEYRWIARKTCN